VRRLFSIFLALVVLATACSAERPTLEDSASREVDSAVDDIAPPVDVVDERLTLRLAVPDGWSYDPADAGPASLTNRVLADLLYEGLTRAGADGAPEAALAERWFISDDRLTWTFELPVDLQDGEGNPLSARDVKQSLERIAARGAADQAASALTAVMGWTDRMQGNSGGVAGISAPDATTLVVRLDSPFELLLDVFASPAYGITGERDDGTLRTTGAFRTTGDLDTLQAVDPENPIGSIALVSGPGGPAVTLAAGDADWAVLIPDDRAEGLAADIIRQPLDLRLAVVARMRTADERFGVLGALEPLLLANSMEGLTSGGVSAAQDAGVAPAAVLLDVPTGPLEPIGMEITRQLQAAGIEVVAVTSDPENYAARLADGGALVFPVVIAGGIGPAGGILRLATPGAVDDAFGPSSEQREELSAAIVDKVDASQRELFADALETALIDDGYLLPIGRFEIRVAIGDRLDGLRHRADGTLDLSAVRLAG
jgi:extracellular solute-binding protein (family 5)